jgi:NhaC family Na+:H+ antiporter
MTRAKKDVHFLVAMIPIVILVVLLYLNVSLFSDDATYGSNQIALLLAALAASVIGLFRGFTWHNLQDGVVKSISSALPAILILLLIGALAGTWMMSGVVPTMIYYGLKVLNPTIFLVAACIVSAIVAVATGSSWSTIATVGVALLGIGNALGLHPGMIAGSIISGAYFGDKMSPLSDTTNLAPAMAGTDLFTHIRYMAYTTVPSIIITLVIFLILGFSVDTGTASVGVDEMLKALESRYYISPVLMIVPLAVIFMIIKKVDAVPALFIGCLLGVVAAIIFQPEVVKEISGVSTDYVKASYVAAMQAMALDTAVTTDVAEVNDLLGTGGMFGMMNTIWLIVCAMTFGGIMEACGLLQKITRTVVQFARSTGSLIATTAGTCVFFNATASDQYLSIVVPGRMFADTYEDRGLAPENLSRTLEDSGTVTSVLFPWNTCGAAQSSVLHVATGEYWFYCFFNIISPLMTMAFGFFNVKIRKLKES